VARSFRVVDTGVREGRYNIALDQAMIEAHQAGRIPDTFRFMRFPPTALIGRHQALRQEIDLEHCRRHGIGVVRRITGGGAIYLDEGQLGWGLVFHRSALGSTSLAELARDICLAVAAGLRRLGVDARYRPRNDIEVDGRKISGTGGFFDGDTLIYQGTVLVDMDPAAMVAALRVPRAKLEKRQLDSAAQRIVTLRELLGQAGGVELDLPAGSAERSADRVLVETGQPDGVLLPVGIGRDDVVAALPELLVADVLGGAGVLVADLDPLVDRFALRVFLQ